MKTVVTGGAGFIGSHVARALLAEGHRVTVIDDLSTGRADKIPPGADHVRLDLSRSQEELIPALAGARVVFHLAALARVPRSVEDPIGTHNANVTGTLHVLAAAKAAGVSRVVYASSSSVYGDQDKLPLTEDMQPNPLNPYACQKLMGEIYCRNFSRVYGLETACLRFFNVYGPGQVTEGPYRLVIGIFLDQMRQGQPLTIHGDGQQTRDFTHVSDVVRATLLSAVAPGLRAGEPVNIGAGQEVSINRIADLIGGRREHVPARGNDERRKIASTARAKSVLGWEPHVSIEDGLAGLLSGDR